MMFVHTKGIFFSLKIHLATAALPHEGGFFREHPPPKKNNKKNKPPPPPPPPRPTLVPSCKHMKNQRSDPIYNIKYAAGYEIYLFPFAKIPRKLIRSQSIVKRHQDGRRLQSKKNELNVKTNTEIQTFIYA